MLVKNLILLKPDVYPQKDGVASRRCFKELRLNAKF